MRLRYYLLSLVTATLLLPVLELTPLPALQSHSTALAQTAVPEDRKAEADRLLKQGNQQLNHNQPQEALQSLQQALDIYQEIGDRPGKIRTLYLIGHSYLDQQQYEQARSAFQQQSEIARQLGDRTNEQLAMTAIGESYLYQRQYPEAIAAFQQSLTVLEENRSRLSEEEFLNAQFSLLGELGSSYSDNGQYAKALTAYQKAAKIAEQLNQPTNQIQLLDLAAATHTQLGNFSEALEASQQAVTIAREKLPENQEVEISTLLSLGKAYGNLGQYANGLKAYQQALTIAKTIGDFNNEAILLGLIGGIYRNQGQYLQALEYFQQSQSMYQTAVQQLKTNMAEAFPRFCSFSFLSGQDVSSEQLCLQIFETLFASSLNNLGLVYSDLGRYAESLTAHQQALTIAQKYKDLRQQMAIFNNIGMLYKLKGEYAKALEVLQQSLQIAIDTGSRLLQATTLSNIGQVHYAQGQYPKALEYYQQTLALAKAINSPSLEATALNSIGNLYNTLGNQTAALTTLQQSLKISQRLGASASSVLSNVADVYSSQGRYPEALEKFQQALDLAKAAGDRLEQSDLLGSIGGVYTSQTNYAKALEVQQQALAIQQEIGARPSEIISLIQLGQLHYALGDYDKALELDQQALRISREIGSREGEMVAIGTVGRFYLVQKQYDKAVESFNQGLKIAREIGHVGHGSSFLNGIGWAYEKQGRSEQAIDAFQQSLKIFREIGLRPLEGSTLNALGVAYTSQGKTTEALAVLRQAIAIHRETGEPAEAAAALSNIGKALEKSNQPELAIVFYKESVNVTESIRQGLRSLTTEQQQSYTNTIADTYRSLSGLLLAQGRILEAQQVLELLKLQELREFTGVRAKVTPSGLELTAVEQAIVTQHDSLITFGQQVDKCQETQCSQLNTLLDQRDQLTQQFNQTLQTFEAQIRASLSQDRAALDTQDFSRSAHEIVEAQPGTVMIYTVVLDNKLWLLWATAGGVVNSVEVPVSQKQLGETVLKFRQLLSTPKDIIQVQATAKQLYDWLIAPIAPELQKNHIQHLVFSLDRVTRYIPMAALFDGQHYLLENYTVSTVLSADLTRVGDRLSPGTDQTSVLALGLSNAVPPDFPALTNVPAELNAIVRSSDHPQGIYPGVQFLNQAFDDHALRNNLLGHQIVHIATHGVFVPGRQDQSYLVLGNGHHMNISNIQELQDLGGVRLVVLSACQTALGGPDRDGIEIAGIAYYFLNGGVSTVMASLWSVNDASTQQLMQHLYTNLSQSTAQAPITRAEALQQAQLSLLHGQTASARNAGRSLVQVRPTSEVTRSHLPTSGLSHPYYWAPFILIGNGL